MPKDCANNTSIMCKVCNSKRPKLSVIIVNYNSEKFFSIVKASLRSIFCIPVLKEVVIVDNGSTDSSRKQLISLFNTVNYSKFCTSVKLILLSRSVGFSNAVNVALKVLSPYSKLVMVVNNDCIINGNGISQLIKILERINIIGCIQGKILQFNDRIDSAGCVLSELGDWLKIGHGLASQLLTFPYIITYAHAACFLCRRECFKAFSKHFFVFGDDFELGPRLYAKGYIILYYPVVAGVHYGSATALFNKDVAELTRDWSTIGSIAILRLANSYSARTFYGLCVGIIRTVLELLISFFQVDKQKTRCIIEGVRLGLILIKERGRLIKSGKSIELPILRVRASYIPLILADRRVRRAYYLKELISYLMKHGFKNLG